MATIPNDTAREVTLTRTAVGRHRLLGAPVVRHTDALPSAVIECGRAGCGVVVGKEEPAVSESLGFAEGGRRGGLGKG